MWMLWRWIQLTNRAGCQTSMWHHTKISLWSDGLSVVYAAPSEPSYHYQKIKRTTESDILVDMVSKNSRVTVAVEQEQSRGSARRFCFWGSQLVSVRQMLANHRVRGGGGGVSRPLDTSPMLVDLTEQLQLARYQPLSTFLRCAADNFCFLFITAMRNINKFAQNSIGWEQPFSTF